MSYNIGPKIGIEGEAEFRRQISQINAEYKTLTAQTNAVTAAFEANGDEQQMLADRSEILREQMEKQAQKVRLLEDAIAKTTQKYSANAEELERLKQELEQAQFENRADDVATLEKAVAKATKEYDSSAAAVNRLNGVLYDTQATSSKLEAQLKETEKRLDELSEGAEDAADAAEDAGNSWDNFGELLGANFAADAALDVLENVAEAVVEIGTQSIEAAAEVKAQASQFEQTFGEMSSAATDALGRIADDAGVSASRMEPSFTAMFGYFKTLGSEAGEAMDYSSRAMTLAADSAAYYDKSIEEVTESLQSFLKGNYENDSALGISCTEITRNTAANEMYAKSFNELSESQKIDVLLSMVEAGNAASGALGQAAREADSWANVTGELEEAQRQLLAVWGEPILENVTPIIQDITDAIYDLIEANSWETVSDGIDDFSTAMEEAQEATARTAEETESTAYIAEQYVERLQELETAGLDTAEAQREYATTVDLLNTLMPELNLEINEQTGLVNKNTEEILDNIQALKDQAIAQAFQEQLTAELEAQADAYVKLSDAERRQLELAAEEEDLKRQLAEATAKTTDENDDLTAALDDLNAIMLAGELSAAGMTTGFGDAKAMISEEEAEVERLRQALAENRTEQDLLADETAELNGLIEQSETQIRDTTIEVGLYNQSLSDATQGHGEMDASIEQTQAQLDALQAEYQATVDDARESIQSQIGLFDELELESDYTAEGIIENWQKQADAINNYDANLQKAIDMGLAPELLQQLSDGSTQSMQVLDALVNDANLTVDEINAAFGERLQADDAAAESMAATRAAVKKELDGMESDAYQAGADTAQGLANGIKDNSYKVERAMTRTAKGAQAAYETQMDINSPSRVMYADGAFTVAGAVKAIEDHTPDLAGAMSRLAEAGRDAFGLEVAAPAIQYAGTPVTIATQSDDNWLDELRQSAEIAVDAFSHIYDELEPVRDLFADIWQQATGSMERLVDATQITATQRRLEYAEAYPSYVMATPAVATNTTAIHRNYGGFEIHIHQQPGEDSDDLVNRLMERMQDEVSRREAAL